MKTKFLSIISTAVMLLFVSTTGALAQHEGHGGHTPAPAAKKKPAPKKSKAAPRTRQTKKPASQTNKQQPAHQHTDNQQGSQHDAMNMQRHGSMGMKKMGQESRHTLAMAYVQNIATFAQALRDQAQSTQSVDAEFARNAVEEMKRNLDATQQHHQEHKTSMPVSTQSQMSAMVKEMERGISTLRQSISALDQELFNQELQGKPLSTSVILQRADEIVKRASEMSKAHGGHAGHSM